MPELCACALFPRVDIRTPIVLVQHVGERSKPTNTARLLAQMVPSIRIVHFPLIDRTFDETPFDRPDVAFRTLFPREDATELAPGDSSLGLVLLDGTWHQCSRMSRRVPRVHAFPCVHLPPGAPSIWRVRTQHDERGMSTFEAGMRAIEVLEGPEVVQPLARAFEVVTARLLFMKGKLRSPEVPSDWTQVAAG